ncbi:S-layer homology domain-containing protein [Paenibacillus marinisediminis]
MKRMRFAIPVMMLCLILTTVVPLGAFAAEQTEAASGSINLQTETQTVVKGSEVKVKVAVRNVTDLYGIQFRVKYDSSKLKLEEAKVLGGYSDFGGQKLDEAKGTVLLPLLREQMSDNKSHPYLEVAELRFTAKEAGEASVVIEQLKAVSSETYINEAGLKDLKEISLTNQGGLMIKVIRIYPEAPNVSTPEPTSLLQQAKQLLKERNTKEAYDIMIKQLSKGMKGLSADELAQWQEVGQQLLQQLQESITLTEDASIPAKMMVDESLKTALDSITELIKLAKENDLRLSTDKTFRMQLTQNGSDAMKALQLTPSQAQLLKQHDMSLIVQWILGDTASSQQVQNHKLGIYKWNEKTSEWRYVREAKQTKEMFELKLGDPGLYMLMEYTVDYIDIDKCSAEAKHAIEALTAKQLMKGTGDRVFSPDREITRAEFTALLVRVLNMDASAAGTGGFIDVDPKAWYAAEVHAAWKAGIIKGDGSRFNPNAKLTREQMAVMLMNASESTEKTSALPASGFQDDHDISVWAKEGVNWAKEKGLIKGVGNNFFMPKANTSRADAAILLLRWLDQS